MKASFVATGIVLAGLQAAATAQAAWTQVATTGPAARYGHAMAYDSLRGKTVLFGGTDNGTHFSDTWEWSGSNWAQVTTAGPSPRSLHAMVYDGQRARVVLFGGYSATNMRHGDTWEWDGSQWTQQQPLATGPIPRTGHAMAYDSQRGMTVLFGGVGGSPVAALDDTWEWNGAFWAQRMAIGPAAREYAAMAYDSSRAKTVMFGGRAGGNVGDTWEWDGTAWAVATATAGPSARIAHGMAYDSQRGKVVLFGGEGNSGLHGDTWEWDGVSWSQAATTGPAARKHHVLTYDSQRGKTVMLGGAEQSGGAFGDAWEWEGLQAPQGSASLFGTGCGSPVLSLSPVANARPAINATAQATLSNIPGSLAFVALGWSRTLVGPFALPFPLVGYGMSGCFMLQSSEVAAQPVAFVGPGSATYGVALPNWSGLLGLRVYLQGWAVAPGANPGNAIVSNGLEWVIGY
jgi:hypothetical protein